MTHLSAETRPARIAGARHGWLLMASCWLSSTGAVLIAPVLPQMRHDYAGVPNADVLTLIVLVIPALMIALFSPLVGSLAAHWQMTLGFTIIAFVALLPRGLIGFSAGRPRAAAAATDAPHA